MSEIAIEVKNLSKSFRIYHEIRNSVFEALIGLFSKKKHYESLLVLNKLNFSIEKGEMFGIIGKNGMGKTTLLRVLSRIYEPDEGEIIVNGLITPFLGLGTGFQPEMTARTNVIQYGILLGMKKRKITELVDDIMKFAELEKFADTKLKNFSSGMYARLAFSTAVKVNPDIILIDEIFQVGDKDFQKKSFDTIMSFKKNGKTIVMVTHDLNSVVNYCDRALLLSNGTIASIGNPKVVLEAYSKI